MKSLLSYSFSMNLRKKAQDTLSDVSDASRQVIDTTEWATVALVSVCIVSVCALVAATLALNATREGNVHAGR